MFEIRHLDNTNKSALLSELQQQYSIPDGKAAFNRRYGHDKTWDELVQYLQLDTDNSSTENFVILVAYDQNQIVGYAEVYEKQEHIEFGYIVFPKFQKQGYGTKLVSAVFQYCRDTVKDRLVQAEVETDNIASMKLLDYCNYLCPTIDTYINDHFNPPTKVYVWKF